MPRNTAAPKAPKAPANDTPAPVGEPAPVATYTKPPKVAPADRRGTSTVQYPVATVHALCIGATHKAGGEAPARKALTALCVGAGVAYNTARTQVQAYLQWRGRCVQAGTVLPHPVPGLALAKGTIVAPGVAA